MVTFVTLFLNPLEDSNRYFLSFPVNKWCQESGHHPTGKKDKKDKKQLFLLVLLVSLQMVCRKYSASKLISPARPAVGVGVGGSNPYNLCPGDRRQPIVRSAANWIGGGLNRLICQVTKYLDNPKAVKQVHNLFPLKKVVKEIDRLSMPRPSISSALAQTENSRSADLIRIPSCALGKVGGTSLTAQSKGMNNVLQ